MRDFSIDQASEKIHAAKTREYFREVVLSYYSESYRSAIVMLYSVAQTDLILKLAELRDIYQDQIAKSILEEIEKLQKDGSSKSDWESKLVKFVFERTELLDQADLLNLNNLQQQRHLCAHPVISQSLELYAPNRETVRALMRNTLEGLLLKPAILSRKVFDSILMDLDNNKGILLTRKDLKLFLDTKYFNKLRDQSILQIFESLWKITFNDFSSKSIENRAVLVEVVKILLEKYYLQLKASITIKLDFYSVINDQVYLEIIDVLSEFPEVFTLLNSEFQLILRKNIDKSANLTVFAWFLNSDISAHVDFLFSKKFDQRDFEFGTYVSVDTINSLVKIAEKTHSKELVNRILIEFSLKSRGYAIATERFSNLIHKNIDNFSLEEYRLIVDGFDLNSQISGRWDSRNSASFIKKNILRKYPDFDFTDCRSFQ